MLKSLPTELLGAAEAGRRLATVQLRHLKREIAQLGEDEIHEQVCEALRREEAGG